MYQKVTDEEILAAIEHHWETSWTSPTCRELGAAVGLSSPASVLDRLRRLENKGLLEKRTSGGRVIYRAVV